jgi:hypothetical protein
MIVAVLAGAAASAISSTGATAAAPPSLPDFSYTLWNRALGPYEKPPSGPGPVQNPPDVPFVFRNNRSNYIGDTSNPILQPWAADRVRATTQRELDGHEAGTAQQTCRPSGLPGIFQLNDTVQIVQGADEVAILYARGHQWRVIHLNQKHAEKLQPSWYGHSIGHYEGDTLVVDTVGLNDKPWADRYGTPQTTQMHVVERYRLVPDPRGQGQALQAHFFVEDPGAFTVPWSAIATYRAGAAFASGFDEQICQENNRELGPEIAPLVPKEDYRYPF